MTTIDRVIVAAAKVVQSAQVRIDRSRTVLAQLEQSLLRAQEVLGRRE